MCRFVTHRSATRLVSKDTGSDGEQVPIKVLNRGTVCLRLHPEEDLLH